MSEGIIEATGPEAVEAEAAAAPRPNFGLAVAAGLGAAVAGAMGWALFTYATNYELGLIAVAIGALVGVAVRKAGHGDTANFAILGAVCAALGCLLGIVLCDVAFLAKEMGRPFFFVLSQLGVGGSVSLAIEAGDAMELLFVAIAIWEGFKFSVRRGSPQG